MLKKTTIFVFVGYNNKTLSRNVMNNLHSDWNEHHKLDISLNIFPIRVEFDIEQRDSGIFVETAVLCFNTCFTYLKIQSKIYSCIVSKLKHEISMEKFRNSFWYVRMKETKKNKIKQKYGPTKRYRL